MSETYAKLLDYPHASIGSSNNTTFFNFSYAVYENVNLVDETWDSLNNYSFFGSLSSFSYSVITDGNQGGKMVQIIINLGNTSLTFSDGEYVSNNGDLLDLNVIFSEIQTALGL